MKVVIPTDGGRVFGHGHIARCISFYDEIKERNYDIQFVIHGDYTIKYLLKDRNFCLFDWHGKINEFIESYKQCDAVILDSLNITQDEISALCDCDFKLLSIDDFSRNTYSNSIILDWTINAENSNKHNHNEANNILLLGSKYIVVRKPFLSPPPPPKKTLHKVLVILGGSDIRNLTDQLIKSISNAFSTIEMCVVKGPGILNAFESFQFINNNIKVYSELGPNEMRDLMQYCDVAISAGGQTLYELAAQLIPTIAIQVIDNQCEDIEGWKEKGLISEVIKWDDELISKKVCSALNKLKSVEIRENITNRIGGIISGNNVTTIINILIDSINAKNRN